MKHLASRLALLGVCLLLALGGASVALARVQPTCAADDEDCIGPVQPGPWTRLDVDALDPALLGVRAASCREADEVGVQVFQCRYWVAAPETPSGASELWIGAVWQPNPTRTNWQLLYTQVEGKDPEPVYTTLGRAAFGLPDIGPVSPREPLIKVAEPYIGDVRGRVEQHPDDWRWIKAGACNSSYFWGADNLSFTVAFSHINPATQGLVSVAEITSHLDNVPPRGCTLLEFEVPPEAERVSVSAWMQWEWVRQPAAGEQVP